MGFFSFKKRQRSPAPRVVPVAIEIISHRTGRDYSWNWRVKGSNRTKPSARCPSRRISRAILHGAGTGGDLRYSYPGHHRTPAVRTDRTHEGHTPNLFGSVPLLCAHPCLWAGLYHCHCLQ